MKKIKINILIASCVLLLLSWYIYARYEYNEVIYGYDFNTLLNIYITIDDILEECENNKSKTMTNEYLEDLETLARYAQLSPKINELSYPLSEISDIRYEKISKEEYEYLINVRDKLKVFIDNINMEYNERTIKRFTGIFSKSRIKELNNIFIIYN